MSKFERFLSLLEPDRVLDGWRYDNPDYLDDEDVGVPPSARCVHIRVSQESCKVATLEADYRQFSAIPGVENGTIEKSGFELCTIPRISLFYVMSYQFI